MPEPGVEGRRYRSSAFVLTRGKLPPEFDSKVQHFADRVTDLVEDELNPQLEEWSDGYDGDELCLFRILAPLPMGEYLVVVRLFAAVTADVGCEEFYEALMEKFALPAVGIALEVFGTPCLPQRVFSVSLDGETEQAYAPLSFFEQPRTSSGRIHYH